MDFDFQENGKFLSGSLTGFRVANELGMGCICKIVYREADDSIEQSLQLRLSADQCRAIGEQLLYQAAVIEFERPTQPQ